jgi:polyisoprenoid-binding protein YceI
LLIETTIDRTEFGIGTGDWAATMVVGGEVRIRIPIKLKKKNINNPL